MEVKVTLTQKDIFYYLVYYLYMGITGFLYVFVGAGAIACGVYFIVNGNKMGIYLMLFAFIYLFLQPYVILLKSKKAAKNPYFSRPTTYVFTEEKITFVMQDGDGADLHWENLYRIAKFNKYYFIFLDKERGHIVPAKFFADQGSFESLVKKMLPKGKIKGIK